MFKKDLQDSENYCLTADLWSDNSMKSYLGITIHFLDEKNEMEKGVLGVFPMDDRSTAEYIVTCFQKVMSEFRLVKDKVSVIVTDEGANISKAADDFFGPEKHLFCAVSRIIPDALAELKVIENIIKKVKTIVTTVKKSSVATRNLEKLQRDNGVETPLKVIQDVDTRFNAKKELIGRF